MQEYPTIQKRAQAEIDAVVGIERPPSFHDRADLPFINALCKEILRYNPPVPAGMSLNPCAPTLKQIINTNRCSSQIFDGRPARWVLHPERNSSYCEHRVSSPAFQRTHLVFAHNRI